MTPDHATLAEQQLGWLGSQREGVHPGSPVRTHTLTPAGGAPTGKHDEREEWEERAQGGSEVLNPQQGQGMLTPRARRIPESEATLGFSYGLNCVPPTPTPNSCVEALTPGPQSMTSFGKRVIVDVIN